MERNQNKINTRIPMDVIKLAQNMYVNADENSVINALFRVLYYICNFCNIQEIPEALYFTWVDMAGYYVRYNKSDDTVDKPTHLPSFPDTDEDIVNNTLSQEQILNKIKSISMGEARLEFHDTPIEEDINSNPRYEYTKYKTEKEFLTSFHHILYNFRRFKW